MVAGWIPDWVFGLAIMAGAALVVGVAYRWFIGRLVRMTARRSPFLHKLLQRGQRPVGAVVIILALGVALPGARFPYQWAVAAAHILLIGLILALGWTAAKALDIGAELYLRRFHAEVPDNLLARKHVTQVHMLLRATQTVLVIITIASALMTVDAVRQYGVSLFASAGAAGIILGLAARPVLSNLLAGIQIAMTQPIRVEDSVIVEGESGWIETITSTYVVIRIWDLRRMIVPLSYFIEKPFQNWTYQSADLLGTVFLHLDYTVPVERLREELQRIVADTPLWDGKVAVLQVTDATPNTLEVRCLVSARNAGQTWDLRCLVRERLIDFLQAEYPHALPRQRTEIAGSLDTAPPRRPRRAHGDAAADSRAKSIGARSHEGL
jgi:small-conductance mechanosensitive channel